jgi:ketol-acid reductoisomerase
VSDADLILICSPAHTKNDILKQIKPHLKNGAVIGTVFGQGAFDWQTQGILGDLITKKNLTIFSL